MLTIIQHLHKYYEEIMRRLVMIPTDKNVGYQKWLLVESVLRQLGGEDDQITFDNKEYFSVKELLSKTESEAKDTLDHQKLLEQRTTQENELLK